MSRDRYILIVAVAASLALGASLPAVIGALRGTTTPVRETQGAAPETADNDIALSDAQIEAARIETAVIGPGVLTRRLTAPAAVKPDPDRVARVAAKVAGVVEELRKRRGDNVVRGEVIAILDSREVADAKSEYLAAQVNYDLQQKLYQREKALFERKITAEQLFLKAKTTFMEAKLKADLARQIAALPTQPLAALRRKEIRAPISGRVIERLVNIGQPVGGEGQPKEMYLLADLSVVEVELAVPPADLGLLSAGQDVRLDNAEGRAFEGKITYVNALITQETRTGQIVARFANPDLALRPGSLLEAQIALRETKAKIKIPRQATIVFEGKTVVFVRTPVGFRTQEVEIGRADDDSVEVVSGLTAGETIAVSNVFRLKAEIGKRTIPEE